MPHPGISMHKRPVHAGEGMGVAFVTGVLGISSGLLPEEFESRFIWRPSLGFQRNR